MNILLAAILQICADQKGVKTNEKQKACYERFIICTLPIDVLKSSKVEIDALKRLNACQYKTIRQVGK